jgi:hypothetical protein
MATFSNTDVELYHGPRKRTKRIKSRVRLGTKFCLTAENAEFAKRKNLEIFAFLAVFAVNLQHIGKSAPKVTNILI